MSRSKTYGLVLALLASAALSTACTRTDTTGPSDQPQPSFGKPGRQQLVCDRAFGLPAWTPTEAGY